MFIHGRFGHGFGGVLTAHLGDGAESTQAVATFGDLQVGKMPRRDPQARAIGKRRCGGGAKHAPLLIEAADEAVRNFGDLLAAENADDVIDVGAFFEQGLFFALRQAPGDDYPTRVAAALEIEHFVDRGVAGPDFHGMGA